MAVSRGAWLARANEAPLEPDRPLVDPHHHLWDWPGNRYLPGDFYADIEGHDVRHSVFVECMAGYRKEGPREERPVGETEWVVEVTPEQRPLVAAIVGFADLTLGGAIAPVLRAHREAGAGRFRGIRHSCTWDFSEDVPNSHSKPPPHLFLRDDFREGFVQLEQQGFLFEAWCYHTQLFELASLAKAFPHVTIVTDHAGGPLGIGPYAGRRDEVFEHWCRGIDELASRPNVVMKLGGLGMEINGFNWHKRERPPSSEEMAAAIEPYVSYCIRRFGVERCMFESNFPVDNLSGPYTVVWNVFKRLAGQYGSAAADALLADNATRVYGLPDRR